MHVASGDTYYTYHREVSSDSDSECEFPPDPAILSTESPRPQVPDLTFFTYVESIVYDAELSDVAINYFVEALTSEKYYATSRLHVGLSLISVTSGDYVVGYVLDPDKMEFKHFNEIRVGMHYQLKDAEVGTNELLGTSHLPRPISRQRQFDNWHMIKPTY